MRTRLAIALLSLSGCSLSADFDAPFPGLEGDALPGPDAGADSGGLPDRAVGDGAVPDGARPDAKTPDAATLDAHILDLALPDGALDLGDSPDVATADAAPDQAVPEDAALPPDAAPPPECAPDAAQGVACAAGGIRRAVCEDGRWRWGQCAAQAPFACGSLSVADPDGAASLVGRWITRPNLPRVALFAAVEQPLWGLCDGCGGPAGGAFDHEQRLTTNPEGGAIRRDFSGADGAVNTSLLFFYEGGQIRERRVDSAGAVVREDVHRLVDGPLRIGETARAIADAEGGPMREVFGYGPWGEVRTMARWRADRLVETFRIHYDADGRWTVLDIEPGDAPAPVSHRHIYDQTCLDCLDRDVCVYDVPERCTHVPLRAGPGGFAGGWPTIACDIPTSQLGAQQGCEAWGGRLARFDNPADQAWAAMVSVQGNVLARVGGEVDEQGTPRWTETGEPVHFQQMGAAVRAGQCLALRVDGLLYGVNCAGGLASDFKPYLCEKRPG